MGFYDDAGISANNERLNYNLSSKSKVNWMGKNELIEDYQNGKVVVDSLSKEELPQEFKNMTKEQIRLSLEKSVQQRKVNIEKLKILNKKRNKYIINEKKKMGGKESFSKSIGDIMRSQKIKNKEQ